MPSQRKAALGFIVVTALIDDMGIGIIIPVMPKLITELTGGGMAEAAMEEMLLGIRATLTDHESWSEAAGEREAAAERALLARARDLS